MNKILSKIDDYHNIVELLKYIDNNTPASQKEIQQMYRNLFGRHMSKQLSARVVQILKGGGR